MLVINKIGDDRMRSLSSGDTLNIKSTLNQHWFNVRIEKILIQRGVSAGLPVFTISSTTKTREKNKLFCILHSFSFIFSSTFINLAVIYLFLKCICLNLLLLKVQVYAYMSISLIFVTKGNNFPGVLIGIKSNEALQGESFSKVTSTLSGEATLSFYFYLP